MRGKKWIDRNGVVMHFSRARMSHLENSKAQRICWFSLLAILFVAVRVHCAAVYRVDSDEPQHLHVVWGVAKGLVQYRDIFDNHSPLFQLLFAPLFRVLGERADIVEAMRMAMIPLYFGCLACVYLICARLFSRQCGVWAALFTAFYPRFFCTSIEFRPDNLWALAWLLLLAVLVCVRRPAIRWLASGLLLGIGFSISMKTTVMALDLAAAGALTWFLCTSANTSVSLSQVAKSAALFITGLTVVPGLLLLHFAAKGALANLYYCLIRHNLVAASERAHFLDLRGVAVLAALAGVIWWCRRIARLDKDRPLATRRVFILLAGAIYPVILFILWPLVTREDFLALMPVVGLVVVPTLLAALEKLCQRHPQFAMAAVPACIILALVAIDIPTVQPWRDRTRFQQGFIASTLRLTDPGDLIMDAKGEMIYRDRSFYYVLEEMTRWMLQRERLVDDIPEQMIAHGVCVAARCPERYPRRTAQFLKENFIPVSFRLLVAGKILPPAPAGKPTLFHIAIPARYALAGASEPGAVLLDGKRYEGPLFLAPGPHSIQTPAGSGVVTLVWAQAIERGFTPLYKLSEEEESEASQARQDNIL